MGMDATTAQKVDTELARLWQEAAELRARLAANKLEMASSLGIRPHYVTKTRREVTETVDELRALAAEKLPGMMPWQQTEVQRTLDRRDDYEMQLEENYAQAKPLEEMYAADPWPRFFLVTNQGGHIHSSMNCSTCRATTSFGWLPDLSGLTEKDAVDAHGPHLCSVCYPTAPVEWQWRPGQQPTDPDQCPGSGTADHQAFRRTSYHGNGRAECNHCGQQVAVSGSSYKMRKHKKP